MVHNTKTGSDTRTLSPASPFRGLFMALLAAIIGIAAGFIAYGLRLLIAFITNLVFYQRLSLDEVRNLQSHTLGIWVVVIPAIGGLIIGLMAKYGTPKIRGHGIPEAMEAILVNRSRIAPRVAILKPLSAALAIGTGGPFGAEGPVIQTGGAFGSLIGQLIQITAAERKVLLACGAAAGMAATFNTPIAAVILAIELLLFEFKVRSFIPMVIASVLATAVHFQLIGTQPMFTVAALDFGIPTNLPYYLLLGLICGLVAVLFTKWLYWFEDWFDLLPFDPMWWLVIGGLVLGLIGLFVPRVLGVGYGTIEDILNNRILPSALFLILIFKSLALFVTIGSGTSGGLLAPMFMVGAALGGLFAIVMNQIIPGANLSPSAFAVVAMAAMFGASARATFTFIIFAFEITQDYHAILPLMLVCVIASGIASYLMRNSIMTEKLARRGLRIHQEYEVDILQRHNVGEIMDRNPVTIPSNMLVHDLADRIAHGDPALTHRQGIPIVTPEGQLAGIITRGDILKALEQQADGNITVLEAGSDQLIVATPNEPLHDAVIRMLQNDIGRLPVVDSKNPKKLVGYLGRSGILEARMRHYHEEQLREPGWIQRSTNGAAEKSPTV